MFKKMQAGLAALCAAVVGQVDVRTTQLAVIGGGAVASTGAFAAAGDLDVTSITGALASAGTGIGLVALAMLGVAGAGIAVKWFLGFLFS